jgi:hypothetical protein
MSYIVVNVLEPYRYGRTANVNIGPVIITSLYFLFVRTVVTVCSDCSCGGGLSNQTMILRRTSNLPVTQVSLQEHRRESEF